MITLESLPVELISDILSELDLSTLVIVSQLSRRLNTVVYDASLNPWRKPVRRLLLSNIYQHSLRNLGSKAAIPQQNWTDILTLASPSFILFDAILPNLKQEQWRECFYRRFLPSWRRWCAQDETWKAAFLQVLYRVWHRSRSNCTVDEAWTKYIVLNRKGHANLLETSTRNFNPTTIFNNMKLESNLMHLQTRIRLVAQFMDFRILAFGLLNHPSPFSSNCNAQMLLRPQGVENAHGQHPNGHHAISDHGVYPGEQGCHCKSMEADLTKMMYPIPAQSHRNYPWYTPGGSDKRWVEQDELHWVGGMLIVAQLCGPRTQEPSQLAPLQDLDLITGFGRHQYTSFVWADLWALAPWIEEKITQQIDGPGLGIV